MTNGNIEKFDVMKCSVDGLQWKNISGVWKAFWSQRPQLKCLRRKHIEGFDWVRVSETHLLLSYKSQVTNWQHFSVSGVERELVWWFFWAHAWVFQKQQCAGGSDYLGPLGLVSVCIYCICFIVCVFVGKFVCVCVQQLEAIKARLWFTLGS